MYHIFFRNQNISNNGLISLGKSLENHLALNSIVLGLMSNLKI